MKEIYNYDYYLVQFSGGKDCTAAFLYLMEMGIPLHKIELWHQLVDGAPGSNPFMDWACTEDYCRQFAKWFGVEIYYQWREGGFKAEMLRKDAPTNPIFFEDAHSGSEKVVRTTGGKGKPNTRMLFPQVSADLRVRWCSSYLKKDIQESTINNQERFKGARTLVITGERGQESSNRAKYQPFKQDRCHRAGRHVDHLMPIHDWLEPQVWEIIKEHHVKVHPCYYLGYSRCSCQFCIFGDADQFATSQFLSPRQFDEIAYYENMFGKTIKRDKDLYSLIDTGTIYKEAIDSAALQKQIGQHQYMFPIRITEWRLPAGAYKKNVGPT